MATSPIHQAVQRVRRALLRRDGAGLTDGQLLECFVACREEAAFASLVRRHGPMVLGVCRRVLRHHHDAEDAFQATFLVLARKAATVRPPERVGNWLYGVACHTALRARSARARRRVREEQRTRLSEPEAVQRDCPRDLRQTLDCELSRLPDKYRSVIVLCDLEGRTRKEVARQLGVPEGTVAGRLARARATLAKRLARHGLAVSGGVLGAVLSQQVASAGVPNSVVSAAIKAASLFATGQAAAGVISPKVVALTEGVLKSMLLAKLKAVTAVLLMACVVGFGGKWFPHPRGAAQSDEGQGAGRTPPPPRTLVSKQATGVGGTKEQYDRSDEAKVEGAWVVVCCAGPGGVVRSEELRRQRWTFSGGILDLRSDNQSLARFVYKMKREGERNLIGLSIIGRQRLGTYVLDGETLVIRLDEPMRLINPKGEGLDVIVLRRVQP